MNWEEYWNKLLTDHKLKTSVEEMNEVDIRIGSGENIEHICHEIYDHYSTWKSTCEIVKNNFWKIVENFGGVHLHTSRIKSIDSLLVKIITKRYTMLMDKHSKYAGIDSGNYRNIITDLIGLRLIINYRGHWKDIHDEILCEFPYDSKQKYEVDKLLPHYADKQYQAEIPKVYYAEGDNIRQYVECGLLPKKHKMDYRSIHYTISFQQVYIELQIRTIYDEAWSDCDHNYVYKKQDNRSHIALEKISKTLSKLTNLSNDIGEQMKDIFDDELIVVGSDMWKTTQEVIDEWDKAIERIEEVGNDIKELRKKMIVINEGAEN